MLSSNIGHGSCVVVCCVMCELCDGVVRDVRISARCTTISAMDVLEKWQVFNEVEVAGEKQYVYKLVQPSARPFKYITDSLSKQGAHLNEVILH